MCATWRDECRVPALDIAAIRLAFGHPPAHADLWSDPGSVKTENTRNAVLVVLHHPFRRARPLNCRTGSAILKPLVREHRAHTAFMSAGHPAMHEVQYLG